MGRKNKILLSLFIASLLFTGLALGSDIFIYPNKNQSQKQQGIRTNTNVIAGPSSKPDLIPWLSPR